MNIRDRLIEVIDSYGIGEQTSPDWIADDILEEFWPVPKEFFVHKTMTDGTLLFEPKLDEDDYCCEFCDPGEHD